MRDSCSSDLCLVSKKLAFSSGIRSLFDMAWFMAMKISFLMSWSLLLILSRVCKVSISAYIITLARPLLIKLYGVTWINVFMVRMI